MSTGRLISAPFIVAKHGKRFECPTESWLNKLCHIFMVFSNQCLAWISLKNEKHAELLATGPPGASWCWEDVQSDIHLHPIPCSPESRLGALEWYMQSCKMTTQLYTDPRGGSQAHDTLLTNLAAMEQCGQDDLIYRRLPASRWSQRLPAPSSGWEDLACLLSCWHFSAFGNTFMSTRDFETRKRNKGFTLIIKYVKIKLTKSQVQS